MRTALKARRASSAAARRSLWAWLTGAEAMRSRQWAMVSGEVVVLGAVEARRRSDAKRAVQEREGWPGGEGEQVVEVGWTRHAPARPVL